MDPPNVFKQPSTSDTSGSSSSSNSSSESSTSGSSSSSSSSDSSTTPPLAPISLSSSSSSSDSASSSESSSSSPDSSSSDSSPSSSSTKTITASSSDSEGTEITEEKKEGEEKQDEGQIYESPSENKSELLEEKEVEEAGSETESEESESESESLKIGEEVILNVEDINKEPSSSPSEKDDEDKLKTFYYLKSKYETDNYERCNQKILKDDSTTSIKKKRKQFAMYKPKCINCKRKVGSIFTIKFGQEGEVKFRKFTAKCGDTSEPCPFNIELNVPITLLMNDEYAASKREIDNVQEKIIIAKNKAVFGIIKPEDAVVLFDGLKTDIDKYSVQMENIIRQLTDVTHNVDKQEELDKKMAEFNENVTAFKVMMSNVEHNDDPTKPVSEFYANVLANSVFELSNLKYAHREISEIGNLNICETFEYLPSDLEINDEIMVISFNTGNVETNPPEIIAPIKRAPEVKKKTTTRATRKSPKNKTVRKKETKDITDVLDDVFQTLVIEDTLETIKPSQLYKFIEDTYKIADVRENYRIIIKNYLSVRLEEWNRVIDIIRDVAYEMMKNGIPRGRIFEQLKLKSLSETDPIQYDKKYKRIIEEMMRRYEMLLDTLSETDTMPKPEWPRSVQY